MKKLRNVFDKVKFSFNSFTKPKIDFKQFSSNKNNTSTKGDSNVNNSNYKNTNLNMNKSNKDSVMSMNTSNKDNNKDFSKDLNKNSNKDLNKDNNKTSPFPPEKSQEGPVGKQFGGIRGQNVGSQERGESGRGELSSSNKTSWEGHTDGEQMTSPLGYAAGNTSSNRVSMSKKDANTGPVTTEFNPNKGTGSTVLPGEGEKGFYKSHTDQKVHKGGEADSKGSKIL
jgi:hypothetical protein